MTESEKQTEERIVEAAREVFIEKGMDGTRMQEIADRAGINKALLHYYFRTKEKLFAKIFLMVFGKITNMLSEVMTSDLSLEDKVRTFVAGYTDLLMANPFLPNFIFNELTRNPQVLFEHFENLNFAPEKFVEPLQAELDKRGIKITSTDFMVNILSMVIFPIVARPLITYKIFGGDKEAYLKFLKNRKETITEFVLNALKVSQVNP
jgi:TetR/AcrR family transcriptional regulator